MADADRSLDRPQSVLLVDYPSPDVPAAFVRRGLTVLVKGGPGPTDLIAWEAAGDEVDQRHIGRPEAAVDVIYVYRPVDELPGILALAMTYDADTLWLATPVDGADRDRACKLVEAEGLRFTTDDPFG
jgi:hypothetical protein